jgi:hypothetical protein
MSNKLRVAFTACHTLFAFGFGAIGYTFETQLQPTLPLIPALCGLAAFFCAAAAGVYFSQIKGA